MPLTLIIFGITGNLAQIKLIPALYDMEEKGVLSEDMQIVGIARSPLTHEQIIDEFRSALEQENPHHKHTIKPEVFRKLAGRVRYIHGHLDQPEVYRKLTEFKGDRIYYLATYPHLYEQIFRQLKATGLSNQEHGFARLMIEKPIGTDLKSAKDLNQLLLEYFKDNQIFRLDHYLGKETLQNILGFRFGNSVFENIINKDYVEQIQITAAEDFGIGKRGMYYDTVGALKDVGQNHLLQMLALATMEKPKEFSDPWITTERTKIINSLKAFPNELVLGQYVGYRDEPSVDAGSEIDTYFAFKTEIQNERFRGVPIYIRGGKKLSQTVTEISIIFKNDSLWEGQNVLIYRIQPNEGIVLKVMTKKPGQKMIPEETYMQFCYPQAGAHFLPDPYERLISDAIAGDQTFFNDAPEIESEWEFIDTLLAKKPQVVPYKPGSWGPETPFKWLEPSSQFCNF